MNEQLYDLVEYVKWITNETTELRKRLRKAEKIINELRKSGEASVDTMINTLLSLKKKQDMLEAEAEAYRDDIKTKEAIMKEKETEKGDLQSAIEDE